MKAYIIFLLLFTSCFLSSASSYQNLLMDIQKEVECYRLEYENFSNKDSVLKVAGEYLGNQMCDSVFAYWEGTPWDFNGYTNTPKKGVIACGYFVSTTLKHAGLNLNRYRMAQQSSLSEVKTIDEKYHYYTGDLGGFTNYVKENLKDGLYILGLSNHVGYLQVKGGGLYFLHSNYYDPSFGVTKEISDESLALGGSYDFVVGAISNNKELIKKWLFKEPVQVFMD